MPDPYGELINATMGPNASGDLITGEGTSQSASASILTYRPGELDLVEWVDQLYTDAERGKHDQGKVDNWEDWIRGYWGDIWNQDLPTFKAPIVVNLLKTRILQEVSDLTDSPTKIFIQKDRTKGDRDKNVEKYLQAFWTREFIDQHVMVACLDAMIYPLGFIGVTFDPNADYGRGKLIVRARNPYTVFPDRDCTNDDDWCYVILKDVMDLTAIRARWVDQGVRVKPDNNYSLKYQDQQGRRGPSGSSGRFKSPLYEATGANSGDGYIKARAAVLTVFIKDEATEESVIERTIEKVNDETGMKVLDKQLVSTKKRKFPYGRLIQVCNGIVLYDGQNPYYGRFPIIRVPLQPTVHSFWPPQSNLSDVLELYRAANKLDSLAVENGLRLNSGEIIADTNSGLDPAKYASIPGQVILKTPGSTVTKSYPPAMPDHIIKHGQMMRGFADEVQGFGPSRVGAGQRGNVSAELTDTEITQAMGITRLRARLLHTSVQKLTEVIFAGMARFYQTKHVIPHVRGDAWEPISWDPIQNPEAYAAHVDPATFSVKSKTMMSRLYLALAKMGKMDDEDLLNELGVPDATEKAKKIKEQLALAAMAKQAQKGRKR